MHQHLNIVTIMVQDLHQALAFYRDGLGWQPWWPTSETEITWNPHYATD